MRITVLTSLYPVPATPFEGVFAARRWQGMQTRGHEVRVVQPLPHAPWPLGGRYAGLRTAPRHEQPGSVPVERPRYLHLPRAHRANAGRFARAGVAAVLAAGRPDVVVLDYAWPAAAAAAGLRAAGLPVVVNGRGSDVLQVAGEPALRGSLVAGLKAAGRWSGVSQDLVDAMDALGEAPGRGCLIPNGVDLELFRPPAEGDRGPARARLAAAHGVPERGALVLVVGHLIERKDPLLALAGYRAARERATGLSDAQLAFVGRGPLEAELRAAVASGDLERQVHLLGEQPPEALSGLYHAADALLLTSSREGRPNVVLEALGSGLPVVATRAGGTAELLPGYERRLLVEERTAAAVGERLAAALGDPPGPAEMRALVEPLSWERSFTALERCLGDAIEEDRAA